MIKLLRNYTGAELEQISDQQAQKLVDLECAEAGLPFAPDPPAPYTPIKADPDVRLFRVNGTNVIVKSREDAERISDFLRQFDLWKVETNWKFGYAQEAAPFDEQLEVMAVNAYSLEKLQARKDVMARDAEMKKAHEAATEKYTKACELRQTVTDATWKVIFEARRFADERDDLRRQLDRCIELADGETAIGLRFFERANPGYTVYFAATVIDGKFQITPRHYSNPECEVAEVAAVPMEAGPVQVSPVEA